MIMFIMVIKVKKIKNKNKYQVYLSMFVKEKDFDNIEYKAWLTDVVSEQIEPSIMSQIVLLP